MVLALQKIFAPDSRDLTVTIRNHRDNNVMCFIAPQGVDNVSFGRWLDSGPKYTELNIMNTEGRHPSIYLEDDNDWHLIVSGNIEEGHTVTVGRSLDFDVKFTDEGTMRLTCCDPGKWGYRAG